MKKWAWKVSSEAIFSIVSARRSFAKEGEILAYRQYHHHHQFYHHNNKIIKIIIVKIIIIITVVFSQEVRRLERKVLKMGKALKKLGLMEDQVAKLIDCGLDGRDLAMIWIIMDETNERRGNLWIRQQQRQRQQQQQQHLHQQQLQLLIQVVIINIAKANKWQMKQQGTTTQ